MPTEGNQFYTPDSSHELQRNSTDTTMPERTMVELSGSASIFTDVPNSQIDHGSIEGFLAKRHIGAYRIVSVNSDALREQIRRENDDQDFEIPLFESPPLSFVASASEEHSSGWQTGLASWLGQVKGDEESGVSFLIAPDGTINGVIRSKATGRVKIEPVKGTLHHVIWSLAPGLERKIH